MSTEELQKRTTVNIQEKANLIWAIADKLVGTYKLFTREFYKYVAPRKSEEIFAHLQELEQQESALMAKIMGR